MAFSVSTLTKGGSDTDASSYTTASITPTTGRLLVAMVWVHDAGGLVNFSTASASGNSLTWTRISTQGFTAQGLTGFYAYPDGTQTSGAVTFSSLVTSGTADGATWIVFEATDAFSVTNTQGFSASNRTTNDTLTLPALSSLRSNPNAVIGVFGAQDDANGTITFTPETGWTLADSNSQTSGGTTISIGVQYRADTTDTTAQAAVSAASDRLVGAAFELKLIRTASPAISGSGTFAATAYRNRPRSASISGSGTFAATAYVTRSLSASISGTGTFAATAYASRSRSASISGSGAWAATAYAVRDRTASIAGSGTWAATASVTASTYNRSATINGSGVWAAAAYIRGTGSCAISGSGTWAATGWVTRFVSCAVNGSGRWSATITGGTTPVEQLRFGGTPQSRRDLDRMAADARLAMILRDDEEVLLCLLT